MRSPNLDLIPLGKTDIKISPLGFGAWQWGDKIFWGYDSNYGFNEVQDAFQVGINHGINLYDTAEAYGFGTAERVFHRLIKAHEGIPIILATKFQPYPWRLRRADLVRALRGSLERLKLERVDLYQIHNAFPPISVETWSAGLADAVELGLAKAVGVSNYDLEKTKRSVKILQASGVPLTSNQVEYSLLHRNPERNGVLDYCQENEISLIAYSPLAQGLLTGNYTPENPPSGFMRSRYTKEFLRRIQPLIALMQDIGSGHGNATPAQVALNWVIAKNAIPIPGPKNGTQAEDIAASLSWHLTAEEVTALDAVSDKINST